VGPRRSRGKLQSSCGSLAGNFCTWCSICYGFFRGSIALAPPSRSDGEHGLDHWWAAVGLICSTDTMVAAGHPWSSRHPLHGLILPLPCLVRCQRLFLLSSQNKKQGFLQFWEPCTTLVASLPLELAVDIPGLEIPDHYLSVIPSSDIDTPVNRFRFHVLQEQNGGLGLAQPEGC